MATIAIPLGDKPVMRVSNGHLAIEAGGICVIFALSSTPDTAKAQLNQLIAVAQEALGGIAWADEADKDPLAGLTNWSQLQREIGVGDAH